MAYFSSERLAPLFLVSARLASGGQSMFNF